MPRHSFPEPSQPPDRLERHRAHYRGTGGPAEHDSPPEIGLELAIRRRLAFVRFLLRRGTVSEFPPEFPDAE